MKFTNVCKNAILIGSTKKDQSLLDEWICTIMMKVDAKIETLKSRPKKPVKEVLKQESIIEELN